MGEPQGLDLSLDDLIKKNAIASRGRGRGRGGSSGGRSSGGRDGSRDRGSGGRGSHLGVQGGGVFKAKSPDKQQRGGYGGGQRFNNNNTGRGGGFQQNRGNFNQQGGRGHQQKPSGYFNPPQQRQQQFQQGGRQGAGFRGRGTAPFQQRRPVPEVPEVHVWQDDEGNVVATLKNTNIVTISPAGEVYIDTGGWFSQLTLEGMNQVLPLIGMKVTCQGDVQEGQWSVSDGHALVRFHGTAITLPPRGLQSGARGPSVLHGFKSSEARLLAQTAAAAAAAAAAAGALPATGATGMGGNQMGQYGGSGMMGGTGMGFGQSQQYGGGYGGGGGGGAYAAGGNTWTAAGGTGGRTGMGAAMGSGDMDTEDVVVAPAFGRMGAVGGGGGQGEVQRRLRAQGRLQY